MGFFQRRPKADTIEQTLEGETTRVDPEKTSPPKSQEEVLPTHRVNHNGHRVTKGIHPNGESGRRGVHIWHFVRISFRSSSPVSCAVNLLWPVVPAAIAVTYAREDQNLIGFILNYIAMVPCANLIGFAGQELARKLPRVAGILWETTLGSVVEIVLFMVLLRRGKTEVIKAAILGSILATMLLCLGLCFFVGGITRHEQTFSEAVSEVGNGLLLTAGLGLIIPAAFHNSLNGKIPDDVLQDKVLHISRVTAIFLIIAYIIYIYFNMHTHHSIYDTLYEADENADTDRHTDLKKDKLTLTECIIALIVAIGLVSLIAVNLVHGIDFIVGENGVSETFMGLILVPLVEKFAEHLTAIDEAWDNSMNLALSHVLGATIQTALLNAPLVILAGWGLGTQIPLETPMDLNFDLFTIVTVILAVLAVGNFLRDQKSNYLEGVLSVIIYIIIAVASYDFPNNVGRYLTNSTNSTNSTTEAH